MSPVQSRSGRASHLDGPASDRPGGHIYVTFERDVTAARTWPARVPAVTSRVNGRTDERARASTLIARTRTVCANTLRRRTDGQKRAFFDARRS